ncbi:hypothetical protein [Fluviispira multicolorata]|uniref:Uncharacterized protein n=1 Tax=Fluviispira multicolorata TaxID=2654512 RepID=A0A833N1P6_9BACT|nr:hypothetical protein [Fluviispira multicolorata]KAB8031010.1 hypothetical protein GCL57_08565 [Fluviispira multicolorata]
MRFSPTQQYQVFFFDVRPDDKKTHEWLTISANNLDRLLSSTLLQLARLEGFIDEDNNIKKRPE